MDSIRIFAAVAVSTTALSIASAGKADEVAQFYRGKTITVIVSGSAGGLYGTFARVLEQHMPKNIPGQPSMVLQFIPGSGGLKATNHVYNVAPRNGTAIATLITGVPTYPVLQPERAKYDPLELHWIGAWGEAVNVLSVMDTAPAKTLEDAKRTEVVLGALGKASSTYQIPALLNHMLGTKFKIVTGYRGGSPIRLAMERGEVHGWSGLWLGWKVRKPEWIRKNRLVHLVQLASQPSPDLPGVPLLTSFARNDEERRLLEFMSIGGATARAVTMPPKVPKARVAAMQKALEATFDQPGFQADMKKRNFTLDPIPAAKVRDAVERLVSLPPPLVAKLKTMIGMK